MQDDVIVLIILGIMFCALLVFGILDYRRFKRAQARRLHDYLHNGGLIRSLIARWKGGNLLTDQRASKTDAAERD